jgi:hypothetical protein
MAVTPLERFMPRIVIRNYLCDCVAKENFENKKKPPWLDGGFSEVEAKLFLRGGGFVLRVFAAETLDTSGGVHQLLLARKERVAGGANFNVDVAMVRGPSRKCIAARAVDLYFMVVRMNGCLHDA